MKNTILLVDGHNLLFQMFFGMPARITNGDGVGVWGVLGFVGALRKMLEQIRPTHVAILFDGEHAQPRREVDAAYKANRIDYSQREAAENPFSQLPHIYRALAYLGIPYAETTDCEVDDWMASYVRVCGEAWRIVIASFDSDYFQLIRENVSVLRYRGEQSVLCDTAYIKKKLDVDPAQYADYKSLVGDAADNIRGAEKIGPKTAAALLHRYGTLRSILDNAAQIPQNAVRQSLVRNRERLLHNDALIRLSGDAPIPIPPEAMVWSQPPFHTSEVLRGIGLLP